jgi:SAM-dependent methyltransferase
VFDRVIATDASEKQIANAQSHQKVAYRVAPAENSGIGSETIDLIMIAQALHWFHLDPFYAEAQRVLKPDGVLAASAYNLLHIEEVIDQVVNRYYHEVVGPFWPPERELVEQFGNLSFPFHEIAAPKFEMTAHWNLDHLLGYLQTWSSTQRFIAAKGSDPLEQILDDLRSTWGKPGRTRSVTWPLIVRIGRKPGSGGRQSAGHKVSSRAKTLE